MSQEVMFSWTKPNETNLLSYFTRFSELELFTYINEFELMMGLFIEEKSVYIDSERYNIFKVIKDNIIKITNEINIYWREFNTSLNIYFNTS